MLLAAPVWLATSGLRTCQKLPSESSLAMPIAEIVSAIIASRRTSDLRPTGPFLSGSRASVHHLDDGQLRVVCGHGQARAATDARRQQERDRDRYAERKHLTRQVVVGRKRRRRRAQAGHRVSSLGVITDASVT